MAGRGAGRRNQPHSELEDLAQQFEQLAGGVLSGYSPEELKTLSEVIFKLQGQMLNYKDLPGRRAHKLNVLEFWLKVIISISVTAVACVTIYSVIWSAKDDKAQESRVNEILKLASGVTGGLMGGAALGHQWTRPRKNGDVET